MEVRRSYCISAGFKTQEDLQSAESIYSALCIERLPLITPDKTDLARKYEELQDQIEFEKSALSEDEVQFKKVTERKKKLTERDEDENLEVAQFEEKRKVNFSFILFFPHSFTFILLIHSLLIKWLIQ